VDVAWNISQDEKAVDSLYLQRALDRIKSTMSNNTSYTLYFTSGIHTASKPFVLKSVSFMNISINFIANNGSESTVLCPLEDTYALWINCSRINKVSFSGVSIHNSVVIIQSCTQLSFENVTLSGTVVTKDEIIMTLLG
jgi:spore coat protein U-like protein